MIDVEKYVEDQIAVFQANEALEKRLEDPEPRPGRGKQGNLFYGPYLIISREKGAGGNALARMMGLFPDWDVYGDGCPNGESAAQVPARADRVVASLGKSAGNTLIFSHGQFLGAFAARWLGMPIRDGRHFSVDTK